MDGFWSKLDNLAYELFGVVLPGLVASVWLLLLWYALGPLVPTWTFHNVPELRWSMIKYVLKAVPGAIQVSAIIGTLLIWYALGHVLNWVSKGRTKRGTLKEERARIWSFLKFKVQKGQPFDPALTEQFNKVSKKLVPERDLSWRELYPLAKTLLANASRRSLLSTYQNKYTLHRSIAAAAAAIFWLTLAGILLSIGTQLVWAPIPPNWLLLAFLLFFSLASVWGFSATFQYYWGLWGDTIVTESHGALFDVLPPRNNETKPDPVRS